MPQIDESSPSCSFAVGALFLRQSFFSEVFFGIVSAYIITFDWSFCQSTPRLGAEIVKGGFGVRVTTIPSAASGI
jgi:hypothetical protein